MQTVMTKGTKWSPPSATEYEAAIVPGKSISVRRTGQFASEPKSFKIGDSASYDSYNLIYTGKIVHISDKGVTILPRYETKRTKRLSIYEFAWRNHKFDAEKVAAMNADTMNYI